MPFETKEIISGKSEYLVQVTYTVERRKIITIPKDANSKKTLKETERSMRDEIIRTVIQELNLETITQKVGDVLVETKVVEGKGRTK